ncbi:MAG: GNAT family N-acetyltransferase, partial [Flavobacteriaceae bacterium]
MIEVIKDKKTWKSALNEIESHDFYHTYEYHQLAKDNDNQPILLKYVENDSHIALPLLIRKINNSSLWDATSIYGYAGPVSKNIDQNFNNKRFRKELHSFFKDQGIVSVFSRLNPFVLSQEVCLDQLGEIVFSGKVVNIDIRKKKELQRLEYQRRLKTHINKSRRLCTIKKAQSKKEVLDFVEIYYKTMHRVGAHKSYFFNENYFFNLLNSKDFETDILLALDNISKKVIGGVMLVKKSKIVHYHLSGVATEHMNKYPIKL